MEQVAGGNLSPSARVALEWAAGSALLRGDGGAPALDSFDLLAGVALAHPRDSRPDQLLDHVDLPLGAVLEPVYPRRFTLGDLAAARERAASAPPPVGQDAAAVLSAAASVYGAAPESVSGSEVSLGALLGGLLETGSASTRLAEAFRDQGLDPQRVRAAYRDYFAASGRGPLPDFLKRVLPWAGPPEVRLPDYLADDPGPGPGGPGSGGGGPPDLIGIGPEVEAFAYLASSTTLEPPLAIGLFGDWGSGKSYFMRALQRRIAALGDHPETRERPQSELPYFRRIAQVEFNAWHYVDGDLWASLVEHLFQNLRVRDDEGPAELSARRAALMELMRAKQADAAAGQQAIPQMEQRLQDARERAERARLDLQEARLRMPRAAAQAAIADETREAVSAVLRGAGVDRAVNGLQDASDALQEAMGALERTGRVVAPFRAGRRGWLWLGLAAVTVVVVPVVVALLLDRLAGGIAPAIGGIASVAGTVAMVARAATGFTDRASRRIEEVSARVDREMHASAGRAEEAVAEVAEAERRLADTRALVERLDRERTELENRLAALPGTVLGEFIEQAAASDELRAHLGVPAIVRRRLEVLSELIAENNGEVRRGLGDPERVNRIILYVDDLDRCPADRVVQVLQAVHLLLAFPLFVVVVAVDKRWLAGSLERHYGPLLSAQGDRVRATPDDYVEKIFQVPFQVPPLDVAARTQLLHGLLPVTGGTAGGEGAEEPSGLADAPALARLVDEFFTGGGPSPWLRRAELRVDPVELAFIDRVVPLLDDTPRSVKRFANVFLLVKSIAINSGRPFGGASAPADHEAVILLLALGMGHPEAAAGVDAAIRAGSAETVASAAGPAGAALRSCVPDWAARQVGALAPWAHLARRFTFAAEPAHEPPATPAVGPASAPATPSG